MIRLGLRFLTWLDQRFPAKVTVTEGRYLELCGELQAVKFKLAETLSAMTIYALRTKALEESLAAIKDAMAKAATPTAAEMHRRAAFIASGRMGE